MSDPWFKFSPSAWRASPELRMCCGAARGLWMEMLCIMHDAVPRGYLCVGTLTVTPQQLANLAGFPLKECQSLLKELEAANVFSRDDIGIYSRRMKKDTERAVVDKANGKGGGNPNLKRGVNPPDKAAGAQEPEPEPEPEKKDAALSASARPQPDFKRIEFELRKAAGCENAISPGLADLSPIIGLMDQGADFEGEILPAVAAKPKPDVRSWKWFIPQIQQFAANRRDAAKSGLPPPDIPKFNGHHGQRPVRRNPHILAFEASERNEQSR